MDKVNHVFQKYDRDHDEALSQEEAMPFLMKYLGLPKENVELMFDDIDKDNNHEISKAELYDFFIEHSVVDFTQQAKSLKEKSQ